MEHSLERLQASSRFQGEDFFGGAAGMGNGGELAGRKRVYIIY